MKENCDCEPFHACPICKPKYFADVRPVRKPGKKIKPGKTKAEREYHNSVASLGCVICGRPASIHHVRETGEPRDHMKVIPLCHDHHQGENGIHTLGKKWWSEIFGTEAEMLKKIESQLHKNL